jgi:hypothetical protein
MLRYFRREPGISNTGSDGLCGRIARHCVTKLHSSPCQHDYGESFNIQQTGRTGHTRDAYQCRHEYCKHYGKVLSSGM